MVVSAMCLFASAHAAGLSVAQLRGAVSTFNQHAVFELPRVSEMQAQDLLDGEVVRWIEQLGGEDGDWRAAAMIVADAPRAQVWVAAQDLHFAADPAVHELRLVVRPPDDTDWYGLVDLPKPFSDRQWLVRSWNNHELAAATGGTCWEHPWRSQTGDVTGELAMVRDAASRRQIGPVTPEWMDAAVMSPANYGAFVAIALPDGRTLFAYHTVFDPGGNIPAWAVAQWAHSGLEEALRRYEARARDEVPGHYVAGHADVIGGDGVPVPR